MPDGPKQAAGVGGSIKGIPTWGWIVGGAVAVGVVYYAYHKSASAPTAATPTDPSIDPSTGVPWSAEGYDSTGNGGSGYGAIPYAPPSGAGNLQTSTTVINQAAAPLSNLQWSHQAVAWLVHHHYTHTAATTAISKYLLGAAMYPHEVAIVEAAVAHVGPPPIRVPIHQVPEPHRPSRKRRH